MKADLVCAGGGIKGIAAIGALCYFYKKGFTWYRAAGTSSGSIIAALIVAGYTPQEIKKMIVEVNFLKFQDKKRFEKMPILGETIGIVKDLGIYCGDYLESWVEKLLENKGVKTFGDLKCEDGYKLKIIASDITRKRNVILPDDLKNYGIDGDKFKVARAVRMSTSIPFYFKPVAMRYKNGISYMVDGGVTCNYPINVFDVEGEPRWPTIGLDYLDEVEKQNDLSKDNILKYIFDIADTVFNSIEREAFKKENKIRTVFIPTLGKEGKEFNITREDGLRMFRSGYKSARKFFDNWDYNRYLELRRGIYENK